MKYKIQFLGYWHVGSGLTAGAQTDADVIKNEKGLPYIPGKTIKGLLKDALIEIEAFDKDVTSIRVKEIFGYEDLKPNGNVERTVAGKAFFSNACLGDLEQKEIDKDLAAFFYDNHASTEIGHNGTAESKSLRTLQVCVPVTLEGYVDGLSDEDEAILKKAFKWLRNIGVNRNRGLGRCKFIYENENAIL